MKAKGAESEVCPHLFQEEDASDEMDARTDPSVHDDPLSVLYDVMPCVQAQLQLKEKPGRR